MEQQCPVEISMIMEMLCIFAIQRIAISHMWLINIWNVVHVTEDWILILVNFNWFEFIK